MNATAIIFMSITWIGVIGLTVFCIRRVMKGD